MIECDDSKCRKVYHSYCLSYLVEDDGRDWRCPRHFCDYCGSVNLKYVCKFCPMSICKNCPAAMVKKVSCPVLSCPALSCPVLSCPVLSCPVLSCPVLSCPVLSCPVLSCPILSCPALPCPALPLLPCPIPYRTVLSYLIVLFIALDCTFLSFSKHSYCNRLHIAPFNNLQLSNF